MKDIDELIKKLSSQKRQVVGNILKNEKINPFTVYFIVSEYEPESVIETLLDVYVETIMTKNVTVIRLLKYLEFDKEKVRNLVEQVSNSNNDGICYNFTNNDNIVFVDRSTRECSVGIVRKFRNNVVNVDSTCNSCPYYVDKKILLVMCDYVINKSDDKLNTIIKLIKNRIKELYESNE